MTTHPILALSDQWCQLAAEFRRWGATAQADVLEEAARDLEELMEEKVDPATAAKEADLSVQTVRNQLSSGKLENWGEENRPLVRRGDLWGVPKRGPRPIDPSVRRRVAGGR